MSRPRVTIYAASKVDPADAQAAAAAVAGLLGADVEIRALPAPPPRALDRLRGQFDASVVLRAVPTPGPGGLALGIVADDLYVRGLNFVFGLASGRRALISTARLAAVTASLQRRRVATEAVHEIGHLLGLRHCRNPRCAMFFSNTLADTDAKGPRLCARCQRLADAAARRLAEEAR